MAALNMTSDVESLLEAPLPRGENWMKAFGISESGQRSQLRSRYAKLKEQLVFKMDAQGTDPLTAFAALHEDSGSHEGDSTDAEVQRSDGSNGSAWSQFVTDENLLQEINTDLDRLYPAGNETFFQNDQYLNVLRQVLFVWCKLHPDVSYRQGMHDVAAVAFYSFLVDKTLKPATCESRADQESEADGLFGSPKRLVEVELRPDPVLLPEWIEADTFIVFEVIMLYLKPFYEIVRTPVKHEKLSVLGVDGEEEPRLFSSFSTTENDDPNTLFGGPAIATPRQQKQKKPALHRLCYHIQYELLEQQDPQLFYHLQNLEIVPETYCLRWIRLLLAREYTFDALLHVWDGLFMDNSRPRIEFPTASSQTDRQRQLPRITHPTDDGGEDLDWVGFPLLRYLCTAKLLNLSKRLRQADNTGCLRLLMQAFNIDEIESAEQHEQTARDLVTFAQRLQNPLMEQVDGPEGVDVVQFGAGSLGIVLTGAKNPFEQRLAVKDFAPDASTGASMGQAQASGRVRVGDLLESVNGVPIVGVTTEEVKRHIQLLARPLYMAFRHCEEVVEPNGDGAVPLSLLSPRASEHGEAPSDVVLPVLLPGEMCYANVEASMQKFSLLQDGSCLAHFISGKLYVTNYRCLFTRVVSPTEVDWQVPVLSIATIDGTDTGIYTGGGGGGSAMDQAQAALGFGPSSDYTSSPQQHSVVIRCKDAQVARLLFTSHSDYSKLYKCILCLAFPTTLLDAFCFAYCPRIAPSEEVPFDLRREYGRLGLLDSPERLRCIDQSPRFDLCDTYPQHLIVPADMTDSKIQAAAAFRSHNRLPVVCWVHRGNGATISRSAQPLVGLKSNRSLEDEYLVRQLCCAGSVHAFGRYVIMDARSQLAAVGNKALGKGTEIPANYRGARLVFMNIDNIHAIRQSLQAMAAIFEPRKGTSENDSSFYGKLDSAGWLRHVRLVLKASVELAQSVHGGVSVLTHCSDGWDRTSQMVSLAELMLDPYYRTLRGFQVLIEKEWCSFGHQFAARSGHARSDASNDQRSPVFLLWLDCVWQFVRQFPTACEFNESLLLALADHVFSCKYSTFMFDCERQRKEFFAKHRAHSIWSDVNSDSDRYTNAVFTTTQDVPILAPSTLSKNIKLWKGYFCRWDPTLLPPVPAAQFY